MAISAARVTRLGLSGFMRRAYGSFAGKEATAAGGDDISVLNVNPMLLTAMRLIQPQG